MAKHPLEDWLPRVVVTGKWGVRGGDAEGAAMLFIVWLLNFFLEHVVSL